MSSFLTKNKFSTGGGGWVVFGWWFLLNIKMGQSPSIMRYESEYCMLRFRICIVMGLTVWQGYVECGMGR